MEHEGVYYRDPRIFFELERFKKSNNDFQEKYFLFEPKFKQSEVREIWLDSKSKGFDVGYTLGKPEHLKIENLDNPLKTTFYMKFLDICYNFNIFLQYNINEGLCFVEKINKLDDSEYIKNSFLLNDNSFRSKHLLSDNIKYKQSEVRKYQLMAFENGLELGLVHSPLVGNRIDTINNERHKIFYNMVLDLYKIYNYGFEFNNYKGMLIKDLKQNWKF